MTFTREVLVYTALYQEKVERLREKFAEIMGNAICANEKAHRKYKNNEKKKDVHRE